MSATNPTPQDELPLVTVRKNHRESLHITPVERDRGKLIDLRVFEQLPSGPVYTPRGFRFRPQEIQPLIEALKVAEAWALKNGWLP